MYLLQLLNCTNLITNSLKHKKVNFVCSMFLNSAFASKYQRLTVIKSTTWNCIDFFKFRFNFLDNLEHVNNYQNVFR